ncbi:unnamed protein product [Chilo suppressalis]|uniref:Vitellogenin domain-containing protein n=1 Tax=Chilo suppressalis TaxID=168631 RepID=A0ABN8APG2_CHISP|nr:unnamed protein product [Chilo suppressalis]
MKISWDCSTILLTFLWISCTAEEYYYHPYNVTRSTVSGIAAYRSALTLDWLAAEDSRQRELAAAFETEAAPPSRVLATECIAYSRPSAGKVARLMLELLKNLEGDDAKLVPELIQVLIRNKLLVETSALDAEPDLEALVKTPGVMMGEPHVTFPRILAMLWLTITDPTTTKKYGWCPINKVNKYLSANKPAVVAKHMRALEPIVARARFIMEEFIQNITPLNIYQKKTTKSETAAPVRRMVSLGGKLVKTVRRPMRYYESDKVDEMLMSTTNDSMAEESLPMIDGSQEVVTNTCDALVMYRSLVLVCLLI